MINVKNVKNVKKAIKKEYGYRFNKISNDTITDKCFDLYRKLINHDINHDIRNHNLKNLDSTEKLDMKWNFLEEYLIDNDDKNYNNFCLSFEFFVKHLFYFLTLNSQFHEGNKAFLSNDKKPTLSHFLSQLNKMPTQNSEKKLHSVDTFDCYNLGKDLIETLEKELEQIGLNQLSEDKIFEIRHNHKNEIKEKQLEIEKKEKNISSEINCGISEEKLSKLKSRLNKSKEELRVLIDTKPVDKYCDDQRSEKKEKIDVLRTRYSESNIDGCLIDSVFLKNKASHQSEDLRKSDIVHNVGTILTSEIYLIYFFKSELEHCFRLMSTHSELAQDYVINKLEELSEEQNRYVPLLLKNINEKDAREEFISDIFKNHKQFQIVGQGGNGKTTSLKNLFFRCLEDFNNKKTEILPIFLELSKINKESTISSELAEIVKLEENKIDEMLINNQLLLFLDGLNEIHSPSDRERIMREVEELDSKTKIIISFRQDHDPQIPNYFSFPIFLIQELKENQYEDFVGKYCGENKEMAEHVLKIIEKQPENLKQLFKKPLLLSRAIEVYKDKNLKLPQTENEIISAFIDKLLTREKEEKKDPILDIYFFKLILNGVAAEINKKYGLLNIPVPKFFFITQINNCARDLGIGIGGEGNMSSNYIFRICYELEIITSENDDDVKFFHQSYLAFFNSEYIKNKLLSS